MTALTADIQQSLITAATSAMTNAYAPYSKFHVGAAILAEDGKIYTGCNVENAAYPAGTCAEAGAISAMANAGQSLCTPCGACRQRIREFAPATAPILICDDKELRHSTTLDVLLPLSFGPDNLQQ